MFSEYGMDKDIVKKNGENIFQRGDTFTLQMNYYTFISVLKYFLDKSNLIDDDQMFFHINIKDLLSSYWDGVGDWKD